MKSMDKPKHTAIPPCIAAGRLPCNTNALAALRNLRAIGGVTPGNSAGQLAKNHAGQTRHGDRARALATAGKTAVGAVSVITPVYNDPRVCRALDSVLAQRLPPGVRIESIVVDDSDDDATASALSAYRDRIKILRPDERRGMYHARNLGLAVATGDVIAFLNADDQYADRDVLADALAEFESAEAPEMVYGYVTRIDAGGRKQRWLRDLLGNSQAWPLRWWIFGFGPRDPGVFWRRSVFDRFGHYCADFLICGDGEFILRACYNGDVTWRCMDRVVTLMTMGGLSTTDSFAKARFMASECRLGWRLQRIGPGWFVTCYVLGRYLLSKTIRGVARTFGRRRTVTQGS